MNFKEILAKIDPQKIPVHVAIIMDGNGRWAKKKKLKRINGHKKGVEAVRKIVEASREVGVKYLTVYAFSTENWKRSKLEVNYLVKLIIDSLLNEIDSLIENGVNIRFIGSRKNLTSSYSKKVEDTCRKSWHNDKLFLQVAMNYGGRKEILDSVNQILIKMKNGEIETAEITEKMISENLYSTGTPDPDLFIRTSGEQRISNFLLWQSAYSEFWFTDTLWPDFTKEEYLKAILEFQNRNRRFGGR